MLRNAWRTGVLGALAVGLPCLFAAVCPAQRVDIPDYLGGPYQPGWAPNTPLQPVAPSSAPGLPPTSLDPYGVGGQPGGFGGPPVGGSLLGAPVLESPVLGPFDTIAPTLPPGVALPGAGGVSPGYDAYGGGGGYGGDYAPAAPSDAFPAYQGAPLGGSLGASTGYDPYRSWEQWWTEQPVRFLYGPRLQHTWLDGGSDSQDLDIHDSDVSVVFAWPTFFGTRQPLYIAPSFSLHQWDGPVPTLLRPADLPARAYSAFLDVGWESHPQIRWGGEIGVRVGVFSDFNQLDDDSFRIMGKGLGRFQVNPRLALRGGVYYLNRVRLKMLPAFGVTWTPNPATRLDIMFPKPKLSQYLTTWGASDLWWYAAGDYGGGVWTVRRAVDNQVDIVDINDIRLMVGIEWGRPEQLRRGRRVGFLEAGWVLDRELVYARRTADSIDLHDTFMIRAGFGY